MYQMPEEITKKKNAKEVSQLLWKEITINYQGTQRTIFYRFHDVL